MKTVIDIILAVILLSAGIFITPKVFNEFRREALIKVNKGLPHLSTFTTRLIAK